MKHYFKYNDGYINIDEENLYLTNTGNWQETKELLEKTSQTAAKNRKKINNKKSFFIIFYIAVLAFISYFVDIERFLYTAAILGVGLFFLFTYFRKDFGVQYKIPLSKIERIEALQDNVLKITFKNAFDNSDIEILKGIDKKGSIFLLGLNVL
ncbi:hypothetical protein [Flavobacterium rhizosphaerae]|uniref:Uncharacterized protein n=1 Tax=Flavobacterium rhizosphaerae TaxID=3163298 RepID=A0ABW8YWQ9_9FLAO